MKKEKEVLTISEMEHRNNLRTLYSGIFVVTVFVWVFRFCLSGLAGLTAPYLNNYYLGTALILVADGLAVLLPFLIFQKAIREPLKPVFVNEPRSEHPVVRCLLGVLTVFCLTLGALALTDVCLDGLDVAGIHSVITVPDFGKTPLQTVYYTVLSTVIYSFVFEVSFRGIALRAMGPENRFAAVFVSGVAFALSDGNPYHLVVRLAVGFILGWFYLRIRSVWACMVLQAACQLTVTLWWVFVPEYDWYMFESFLILAGIVLGATAAFFLFYPRRDPDSQITSNKVAFRQVFFSFGIWLMITLVAFNMLTYTFHMEDAPDSLTPEQGQRDPLFNDPSDRQENIPGYQEDYID